MERKAAAGSGRGRRHGPKRGSRGSPATRGAGDKDRAGGDGLRGPRRVARSSRPRPLLLELPPAESRVGEAQRSLLFPPAPPGGADSDSAGRGCSSAASGRGGRGGRGVCGARGLSAGGVCVVRSRVWGVCVRDGCGVCAMCQVCGVDPESTRCVGWMQCERGVCRVDAGRVR